MAIGKQRVLIFLGSPRKKGNSAVLANALAQGAVAAGVKVEFLYLNGMKIHACQACAKCRLETAEGCVVQDDMAPIYDKIKQANALVFVTPVYWYTVSAQLKAVMDRFYAFGKNNYQDLAGKKAAVVLSFGLPDAFCSGAGNTLRTFQDTFHFLDMRFVGQVYGQAYDVGEIEKKPALLETARTLGRKLAEQS